MKHKQHDCTALQIKIQHIHKQHDCTALQIKIQHMLKSSLRINFLFNNHYF